MRRHSRILGKLVIHQIRETLKGRVIVKKRFHIYHKWSDLGQGSGSKGAKPDYRLLKGIFILLLLLHILFFHVSFYTSCHVT